MQKYIIVTGGELRNKGAQAMTFITVDQIAKKYPQYRVVLVSKQDYKRPESEKKNYKFDIIAPMTVIKNRIVSSCFGGLLFQNDPVYKEYLRILKNSVALIDISGYALGSNWGAKNAIRVMQRICLAKYYNIPVYFMPQSYGPFDFKGKMALIANYMIKHYLSYAKVVYAREYDGLKLLEEKYRLKNVVKANDLVLQNKGFELSNIYHNVPEVFDMDVPKGSVAIIPNSKNNKFGEENEVMRLYQNVISRLLDKNKKVYLIYHAVEDLKVCEAIKEKYFTDNKDVLVVEKELSCVDFDNLVEKFDFIIGSRYHSIVHAYRKSIPAVILGWAIKYRELAKSIEQENYCFDVKDVSNHESILSAVDRMCEMNTLEAAKISNLLCEIQKENVYDVIEV